MEIATAHAPRLERARRVAGLVLDPDVVLDPQQRREALGQRDLVALDERQHLAIAPQRRGAVAQVLAPQAHA